MLPNSIFYHITDSYYIVECVQKDEVRFVVPVAFLRARLKHFLHINILYSMLLKQIFVMDTTEKLVFLPPIKFFWTIHAVGVPITLVPVPHTKKRQQCWHKMGLQKGQYMQVLKSKMMKILPRVLWFWLLQRDIIFKSFVQWQAKVRLFLSPHASWKTSFSGYRNA